ncbi:CoF synthetase [Marinobacter panjinensis]|uniref:CoF synthetase n=1 Tax=Marinobacter panjinensis TaxID=2576384 RepID=A0A4U6R1H5_9GAMM|nr:CoF synthetase [Marinobacter panjinensis]MCR8915810.1 CoF synthetase [Marinobacter panjinensis]TKV67213.1 CoF synthetase [Marinobacter panjinensis]
MIRQLRYILTRVFLHSMGLRVEKWHSQVSILWSLDHEERNRILERMLQVNRPINADGDPVTSLAEINSSPLLSKGRYRKLNSGTNRSGTFKRKTSGTTGEPTTVTLSREDLSRMLGVRDYCFRKYGVRVGDREARFWGRPEFGLKNNIKNFALNRKVCFPSGDHAKESLARILNWAPDYLYGYASLLLEAAALIEKHSMRFRSPKCVICTAETVLPAQKEYLAKVFNAPVAEEYGATEFDIVAFECRDGHRHFVNPWLIIKESDESLLITDVSRKPTSLVNYELGDSGSIEIADCDLLGGSSYLNVLTGRSINRFVYIDSETKFHSVDLSYAINEFQSKKREIFSFQIIQNEYGILNVYISDELQGGNEALKNFMENYILRKTGNRIFVNVSSNKKPSGYSSKSYFTQNISASIENVA